MPKHSEFQLAGGSVTGRDHRLVPKNCQDAFHIVRNDACSVGIVTDGSGSAAHSEVGAQLGARILSQSLATEVQMVGGIESIRWGRIQQDVLSQLHVLARAMGGSYSEVVTTYFMFSIVGFIITDTETTFFYMGDGVMVINGEVTIFEPMEGNQPVYLAYAMTGTNLRIDDPGMLQLRPALTLPSDELVSFLIGCDGVLDILKHADDHLPGMDQSFGTLDQFWLEDIMFNNPDGVRRRLWLMARDYPRRDPQPGLLHDDTTLIVGRSQFAAPTADQIDPIS